MISLGAVEFHLCGLIGSARHSDIQKIQIIGFLFEKMLHWQFAVRLFLQGASVTNLLRFNDHGEDFLEQIINVDETWVHQLLSRGNSAIHGMETSRVSHHQKIQDINQLWENDGDCVLGHNNNNNYYYYYFYYY